MESADVLVATPVLKIVPNSVPTSELPVEVKVSSPCPWGKLQTKEVVSFNDVMSEQLAKVLTEEETSSSKTQLTNVLPESVTPNEFEVTEISDDFLLAKTLQMEYDKEHDEILSRVESKRNGDSKLKITFDKYRNLPCDQIYSSDEDDPDYSLEQSEKNHWQNLEQAEKAFHAVGRSGVNRQGDVTTTKHDLDVSGRRNTNKLLKVSSNMQTGDAGLFDMKISNTVFNKLRCHSVSEARRKHKFHDKKEKATAVKVLDEKTSLILYKMISNEVIQSLSGCISTGKEACVFHAWSAQPEGDETPAREFALKVFKTSQNEFHNREAYIRDDYRFRHRLSKQNPRKIIHMWAEKEMRNLLRMREAKIPCPEVITLKKHVLVMTFIGKDTEAAPKIRDVDLPYEDLQIMYEQTIEILKSLYNTCQLVHADFSEYNLLWFEERVWVIDVSQAVDLTHPRALEFLLRDCTNMSWFFDKKGVLNVPNPENLFFEICGKYPVKAEDALPPEVEEGQ